MVMSDKNEKSDRVEYIYIQLMYVRRLIMTVESFAAARLFCIVLKYPLKWAVSVKRKL